MNFLRKLFNKMTAGSSGYQAGNEDSSEPGLPAAQGYHGLPGSRQWSPNSRAPVKKDNWKPCAGCGRKIPVAKDWSVGADGQPKHTGTWTAVCPFCGPCQVGTPVWHPSDQEQKTCHECATPLGEQYQCPNCLFPRGWMRVDCPYCGKRHPVLAPHWTDRCDTFRLECVHCDSIFISLCIC
jgi:hypothetical protein